MYYWLILGNIILFILYGNCYLKQLNLVLLTDRKVYLWKYALIYLHNIYKSLFLGQAQEEEVQEEKGE